MKILTIKLEHHLDIPTSKSDTGKNPLKRVYHKISNTAIVLKMEQFSIIMQQWNKKMQMEWKMTQQYDQGLHY